MGMKRRSSGRGITLIELMAVVAIIGVLATLAIYGVSRYLRTSKSAEAMTNLGTIAKEATESLSNVPNATASYHAPGTTVSIASCICATAANTVPAAIAQVAAKKYTSDPLTDWHQGAAYAGETQIGWRCLKFEITQPQYYMYNYTESVGSCVSGSIANDDVHAIANGDLDNNGILSTFDLEGKVPAGESTLIWAPTALQTLPEE
jgi:type IV pilus assembly protein PilA